MHPTVAGVVADLFFKGRRGRKTILVINWNYHNRDTYLWI